MAASTRQTSHALDPNDPQAAQDDTQADGFLRALELSPRGFDFFHVMRCLEAMHRHQPRFGESKRSSEDALRIGQNPQLGFAPTSLESFVSATETRPAQLMVHFLGLWGANGPMPYAHTEYARDRLANEGDPTLARFVDLFHHRLLSLFYRAWATAQPAAQLDRENEDSFSEIIRSVGGYALDGCRQRDVMSDQAKHYFAGHLALATRPAGSLAQMISASFAVPVHVDEFQGQWLPLPEAQQFCLGEGGNASLGWGGVMGESVWDCQQRFRVVLGPLSHHDYQRFLPGDADATATFGELDALHALIRNFVGDELEWEVELELSADDLPRCTLGGDTSQLGWTSWLSATDTPLPTGGVLCGSARLNRDPNSTLTPATTSASGSL